MLAAASSHSAMRLTLALPLRTSPLLLLLAILAALLPPTAGTTEPPKVIRTPEGAAAMAAQQQRNMLENSLKPFYYINNKFLDIVQPQLPDPRVLLTFVNQTTNAGNASVAAYFQYVLPVVVAYPGYVALLCLGLLLLIVMPIVGACWCSCRCCCNRCGATAKPMDGKFARCRRGAFGVFLGVLSTLVLGGAVLSFISNDLLHRPFQVNSHDNPVTVLNSSLIEISDSLDGILKNFNNQTLLVLGRQVPLVKASVKNASDSARDQIMAHSGINGIIAEGKSVKESIQPFTSSAELLKQDRILFFEAYQNMTTQVNAIANNLQEAFNSCLELSCNTSRALLSSLEFIPTNQLNRNLSDKALKVLTNINNTEIAQLLEQAKTMINNISEKMTERGASKVDDLLANLNDSKKIDSYFKRFQILVSNVTSQMRSLAGQLNNGTVMNKKWKSFLAELDEYRMYGFIGLASTILLIVFFFYLGLCFGACGEPPYEDARMCNRGAGATLMSCGIGFTFLFFPVVILAVTATFLVGAPVRTEICRFLLKEHKNATAFDGALSKVLNDLNISITKDQPFPRNFTFHVLGDCENNTSIVTALGLERFISGSIIYEREVQPSVKSLRQKMKEIDPKIDIGAIDKQAQSLIDALVSEGLTTNTIFDEILSSLNQPTIKNFDQLSRSLTTAGNATNNSAIVEDAVVQMEAQKKIVEEYVTRLRSNITILRRIGSLQRIIGNFRTKIGDFTKNVKVGSAMLIKQIDTAFDTLEVVVRGILVRSVDAILSEYASCRTMNQQATRMVNLVCRNLLDPFNGFWLGIGWSLLILIPSMILACKLNYLYRKTEYYVKDYEEPDYLTYQGFYPSDVIPLERTRPKRA